MATVGIIFFSSTHQSITQYARWSQYSSLRVVATTKLNSSEMERVARVDLIAFEAIALIAFECCYKIGEWICDQFETVWEFASKSQVAPKWRTHNGAHFTKSGFSEFNFVHIHREKEEEEEEKCGVFPSGIRFSFSLFSLRIFIFGVFFFIPVSVNTLESSFNWIGINFIYSESRIFFFHLSPHRQLLCVRTEIEYVSLHLNQIWVSVASTPYPLHFNWRSIETYYHHFTGNKNFRRIYPRAFSVPSRLSATDNDRPKCSEARPE